ncbi:MAG: hypothetical protein ABJB16_06960 [Saprospiraceae bacterium]
MKSKLATAILLPAICVLLVVMLKLSGHASQKNLHLEKQEKKENEIQIIKELHNFHNSLFDVSIKEKLIDSPAKSMSDK